MPTIKWAKIKNWSVRLGSILGILSFVFTVTYWCWSGFKGASDVYQQGQQLKQLPAEVASIKKDVGEISNRLNRMEGKVDTLIEIRRAADDSSMDRYYPGLVLRKGHPSVDAE